MSISNCEVVTHRSVKFNFCPHTKVYYKKTIYNTKVLEGNCDDLHESILY